MTPGKIILLLFSALLVGCATNRSSHVAAEGGAAAIVHEVTGQDVRILDEDREWKRAEPGARVREGDRVRTGPNDTVTISLGPNGGIMTIMPNSDASFERIGASAAEPDVLAIVVLTAGRIVGDTMNPPGQAKILIRTLGGTHELR